MASSSSSSTPYGYTMWPSAVFCDTTNAPPLLDDDTQATGSASVSTTVDAPRQALIPPVKLVVIDISPATPAMVSAPATRPAPSTTYEHLPPKFRRSLGCLDVSIRTPQRSSHGPQARVAQVSVTKGRARNAKAAEVLAAATPTRTSPRLRAKGRTPLLQVIPARMRLITGSKDDNAQSESSPWITQRMLV
ncbi:hypothetical protein HGRIS_002228 [Hohenbuehelia grisea]|uniref:Uncharacterized protein n=1 Tax=Hohenbuehelia grisea TaxID=104357 RepID=A0ABR3JJW4_9AGAR